MEDFEEQLYFCLFETCNRKDPADAKDDEIVSFSKQAQKEAKDVKIGVWKERKQSVFSTPAKKGVGSNMGSPIEDHSSPFKTPTATEQDSIPLSSSTITFSPLTKHASGPLPAGSTLVKVQADLYYFDKIQAGFVRHLDQAVFAEIRQTGEFLYHLIVSRLDGSGILLQPLQQRMNPFCDYSSHSFTWVWINPETDAPFVSWSLHFGAYGDGEQEKKFNSVFYGSMYEAVNRESLMRAKSEQQEYLSQVFQDTDVDMLDADEESQQDEFEDARDDGEEEERHVKKTIYESSAFMPEQGGDGEQNSLLAVGYKHNRSFVVRGSKIGVFRHGDDNLEFAAAINNISNINGAVFSPRKVMLHQQDSKMIMMDGKESKKLHVMDLEYGKVVDEWKVDENVSVADILPDSKYAQLSHSQTLLGINSKAMFKLDG